MSLELIIYLVCVAALVVMLTVGLVQVFRGKGHPRDKESTEGE